MPDSRTNNEATYRNLAIPTVLARDVYGYLMQGLAFWILIAAVANWPDIDGIEGVLVVVGAIAISHPTGRILYNVGHWISERPFLGGHPWSHYYGQAWDGVPLKLKRLDQYPFCTLLPDDDENAAATYLFQQHGNTWLLSAHPEVYFVTTARSISLRLGADTMAGFAVVATAAVLFVKSITYSEEKLKLLTEWYLYGILLGGLATLVLAVMASRRLMKETAESSVAGLLTFFPKGRQCPESELEGDDTTNGAAGSQ